MNKSDNIATSLLEINAEDIGDVAVFLNKHISGRLSTTMWGDVLRPRWPTSSSNSGFMLKDEAGKVVGVLCAIYSKQLIKGKEEQVCNLHSWAVLPKYRTKSISLVLTAIRQKGFHYTMFTPNKSGVEIFLYLKFKPLNDAVTPLLNVPLFWGSPKFTVISDDDSFIDALSPRDRQVFNDHAAFPWLNRLMFRCVDKYGFILYRRSKYKRLPSARILFISDRELFFQCWRDIRSYLLHKHKLFSSVIDSRFVEHKVSYSLPSKPSQQTFYLSSNLTPVDIECVYSELMVLGL